MTSKIEVPRELLQWALDSLDESIMLNEPSSVTKLRALLAAPEAPRQQPIGWFTDDYLTDKSSTTYDELTSNRWKDKGWPVHPLYTAPLSPDHSGGAGEVEMVRLLTRARVYARGEFRGEIDAFLSKFKELNQ